MSEYSERDKHNPFDAYMNGLYLWLTPRQILIVEKMCEQYKPEQGIEEQAFTDFKEQIGHEAAIKRKKYFGADHEEIYSIFDPS